MRKAVLYPFTKVSNHFINLLCKLNDQIKLKYVIPADLTMYWNEDLYYKCDLGKYHISVMEDIDSISEDIDLLIVPDIIASEYLSAEIEEAKQFCEGKNIEVIDFRNGTFLLNKDVHDVKKYLIDSFSNLHDIGTPIIYISELVNNVGAEKLMVDMHTLLRDLGYNVVSLFTNNNYSIIGGFNILEILSNQQLTNMSKIRQLNALIKAIENVRRPDVIIIQIPSMFLRYSNSLYDDCGTNMFLISRAVCADYMFCCSQYQNMSSETAKSFSTATFNQYGVGISCGEKATL